MLLYLYVNVNSCIFNVLNLYILYIYIYIYIIYILYNDSSTVSSYIRATSTLRGLLDRFLRAGNPSPGFNFSSSSSGCRPLYTGATTVFHTAYLT